MPEHPMESEATPAPEIRSCPYCVARIPAEAKKCRYCGEWVAEPEGPCRRCGTPLRGEWALRGICVECAPLVPARRPERPAEPWSPGAAAVMSLMIPGAGQMYKGSIGAGFGWLIVTLIGYLLFIVPGLVIHTLCILNAHSAEPKEGG